MVDKIKEDKKDNNPSWKVTISTEQIVAKKMTYNYSTKFHAATLEEAFKTAQEKAAKMKEEDPAHGDYIVTYVNLA